MEPSTFQKETALSTAYDLVYAGPIESLAKDVGYMLWNEKGNPGHGDWCFRTEHPHTKKSFFQGVLGLDIERTQSLLLQLGLLTGKETINYDCIEVRHPVDQIRFRLFSEEDQLIDDNGKFSERDGRKSLHSATKGALETYVTSLAVVRKNNGKKCRTDLEPGGAGIPSSFGELLGKYLLIQHHFVLREKNLCLGLSDMCEVLSDLKFKVTGDEQLVRYKERNMNHNVNHVFLARIDDLVVNYVFLTKADIAEEKDWAVECFQLTLDKIRMHTDFQEALTHYSQLREIRFGGCGENGLNPSAVIRSQKQTTESPYHADLGEMVFRHYDPPLSRMARVAEEDKDMMTLLRLV